MDFFVYVSENKLDPNFSDINELIWSQKNVIYGDWHGGPNGNSVYELKTNISISERVQNNGSIYLHVYIVKHGYLPYAKKGHLFSERFTIHKSKRLNMFKKRKFKRTHNLLTKETRLCQKTIDELVNQSESSLLYSHWHPNLIINLVDDHINWVRGNVPKELKEFIEFDPQSDFYYPMLYLNDYYNLLRDYQPINTTTKLLPLHLTFQPITFLKFLMVFLKAYDGEFSLHIWKESEEKQDSTKEFLETSPYLFGLFVIVFITNRIFKFLAFENDIQFWNEKENLEGLSVKSVFFKLFHSLIILLYVLDNDTNTFACTTLGLYLLIQLWMTKKVVDIHVDFQNKWFGLIPSIRFEDKSSYANSPTKEYDNLAFKYLFFPLLVGYCIYSLIYQEHKGWYSWVLNMFYSFLLTEGFISMTPQLFINYKLKSVAHLTWRMMMYKSLHTFMDDIFAFYMQMPTLFRLACFRDDFIFLIYLYQRWIYKTDYSRVNEFGVSGDDLNYQEKSNRANEPNESDKQKSIKADESKKDQ